jgi:Flp pilus assembly pilin Flp
MLKSLIRKFVADEGGFLNSAELAFLGTLLVIGIVPGIVTLRDAIVCEFADMAEAVNPGPQHHSQVKIAEVDELPVGERPTVAADIFP